MGNALTLSLLLFLNLIVIAMSAGMATPAPAPAIDCTPALLSLADCLTFVEPGSNLTKPEGDCCSGLKKVVKEEAHCLCEAFAGGSNLGIPLDITKALTLPSVCKVKTPPPSKCKLAEAPGGAPASAPSEESPSPLAAGDSTTTAAPTPAPNSIAVRLTTMQPATGIVFLLISLLCQFIN